MYLHWNRRSGFDRRYYDNPAVPVEESDSERRHRLERRRPGSDSYLLVLGKTGVDRFGLLVLLPALLLLGAAVLLVVMAP